MVIVRAAPRGFSRAEVKCSRGRSCAGRRREWQGKLNGKAVSALRREGTRGRERVPSRRRTGKGGHAWAHLVGSGVAHTTAHACARGTTDCRCVELKHERCSEGRTRSATSASRSIHSVSATLKASCAVRKRTDCRHCPTSARRNGSYGSWYRPSNVVSLTYSDPIFRSFRVFMQTLLWLGAAGDEIRVFSP